MAQYHVIFHDMTNPISDFIVEESVVYQFFTISPQYKNTNIANFILTVPSDMN